MSEVINFYFSWNHRKIYNFFWRNRSLSIPLNFLSMETIYISTWSKYGDNSLIFRRFVYNGYNQKSSNYQRNIKSEKHSSGFSPLFLDPWVKKMILNLVWGPVSECWNMVECDICGPRREYMSPCEGIVWIKSFEM